MGSTDVCDVIGERSAKGRKLSLQSYGLKVCARFSKFKNEVCEIIRIKFVKRKI